ncbi:TetR/AcrR family transcriptional regulator [Bremerella cremea]|uniref:TetR/AcrR family transcriptional regulator n=1 Tax=Blastopirellula marina TaxID=124 RepID=A0A2S8FZV9_9BACT|nr:MULTISPECIES: TetR/AcrR family transcriptional regulator [Pirellulaceae]PQO37716.1 TetR/AcrR family transcriptional regulator [Blastopirellula marina]RCS50103.1 TetR/AcrR family transcriptional regulator [Bremerella cremea]
MSKTEKQPSARQRLLQTAERLFYAEGIRAVGIDRIIAEAEVAKTTLYSHFPSKDALILAVLQKREVDVDNMFEKAIERSVQKGGAKLEGFFSGLKRWFQQPGFRGCSFINAAVELADSQHDASQFASAHKQRFHSRIEELIAEDYSPAVAKATSAAISLLVEGAIISAVLEASAKPADTAKATAMQLIDSFPGMIPSH